MYDLSSFPEEKREQALQLIQLIEENQGKIERVKGMNKFWYFVPNTGIPTEEGFKLLRKYLRPEDVPDVFDSQEDIFKTEANIYFVSGGNRCLGGESLIYDPVRGGYFRLDEIGEDFHVLSWNGKALVNTKALKPFRKEVDKLFRFNLSNGDSFVASMSHQVLTSSGYQSLSEVPLGCELFLPPTNLDAFPLTLWKGVLRLKRIVQGSLSCYRTLIRLGGELLRFSSKPSQDDFPSPSDVRGCSLNAFSYSDEKDRKPQRNHFCLRFYPLSNRDDPPHHEVLSSGTGYLPLKPFLKQALGKFREVQRFVSALAYRPQSTSEVIGHSSYTLPFALFLRVYTNKITSFLSKMRLEETRLFLNSITYLRDDHKWDFTVPEFHNYYHAGAIHHNSSKSVTCSVFCFIFATRQVPLSISNFPKSILPDEGKVCNIRVVAVDNKQLKNVVLPSYEEWCPKEYLINGRWKDSFMSETKVLTLQDSGRNIARVEFLTNEMDVDSFQGGELDLVIYDEEPKEKIHKENVLRFATAKRMTVIFGMTPTKGMSWTSRFVFKMDDGDSQVRAFKLVPVTNRYVKLDVLDTILSEITSYEELRMRLLGEFVSLSGLVYPSFRPSKFVIPAFEINDEYVVYRGLDPHQVTPTAVVWVAVNREGVCFVIDCMFEKTNDVDELKKMIYDRSVGYRLGRSVADRACDMTVMGRDVGGINIFRELSTGKHNLMALKRSQRYKGSICSGVNEIRKRLRDGVLFFFDTPNNRKLIESMMTLEREQWANEDEKGMKDVIKEGKHHLHAAMRYTFQFNPTWYPKVQSIPIYKEDDWI